MRSLVLVALVASTASAQPPACPAKGTPLIEIHHMVEGSKEGSTVRLYDSGALKIEAMTAEGKPAQSGSGCLDKDRLAKVKQDLADSPWRVTRNQVHCMAYSPKYTEYFVNGQKKFTQRLCSPDVLDEKTAKNLEEIEGFLK